MLFKKYILKLLPLLLLCLLFSGCGTKEPIRRNGFYFDTIISITLYDPSKTKDLEHCFSMAETYEQYFSTSIPDSDISKINAAAGKPVQVHEETLELIQKGITYAQLSNGKFDITIGKLTDLWDFQAKTPSVPDAEAAAAAADTIDYRNIQINGNEISLSDPDSAIDLGGIAKGYIADKMKSYLLSQGVTSGLINLGGNVLTIGEKADGSAYSIGIQRPFDETGASIASVSVKDRSVVTSGIYERCFEQDGIRYHHILDTGSGYPYDNGLLSVSIICKDSTDGDALSTACFALGLVQGMKLVESLEQTEAIFITSDEKLHTSSGIGTEIPMKTN